METEVEVDVPVDAMIEAILDLDEPARVEMARSGINYCYAFLRRIPDEIIAEMNATQRELIANALKDQAARYVSPL